MEKLVSVVKGWQPYLLVTCVLVREHLFIFYLILIFQTLFSDIINAFGSSADLL